MSTHPITPEQRERIEEILRQETHLNAAGRAALAKRILGVVATNPPDQRPEDVSEKGCAISDKTPAPDKLKVDELAAAIAKELHPVAAGLAEHAYAHDLRSDCERRIERTAAIIARHLAPLVEENERLKAENEFNFGILKDCHRILEMTNEQSYSLIPGEIEEWLCSHARLKDRIAAYTDPTAKLIAERDQLRAELNGRTQWQCVCGGTDCAGQVENEKLRAENERLTKERPMLGPDAINEMTDRFLRWPLPFSVCSDRCATEQSHGRTGTNLLTVVEAKAMIGAVVGPYLSERQHELDVENTGLAMEVERLTKERDDALHHLGDHTRQLVAEVDETARLEKENASIRADNERLRSENKERREQCSATVRPYLEEVTKNALLGKELAALRADVERLTKERDEESKKVLQTLIERDRWKSAASVKISLRDEINAALGIQPGDSNDDALDKGLSAIKALRARVALAEELAVAVKSYMARAWLFEGQRFYDRHKPEWETMTAAIVKWQAAKEAKP